MFRQNDTRQFGKISFVAAMAIAAVLLANRAFAVPLLAVDFGTAENYVQSGFSEMAGVVSQSTAGASFGTYTVDLAGQGFGTASGSHAAAISQNVRPLFR